jgi:hypothetical protein
MCEGFCKRKLGGHLQQHKALSPGYHTFANGAKSCFLALSQN